MSADMDKKYPLYYGITTYTYKNMPDLLDLGIEKIELGRQKTIISINIIPLKKAEMSDLTINYYLFYMNALEGRNNPIEHHAGENMKTIGPAPINKPSTEAYINQNLINIFINLETEKKKITYFKEYINALRIDIQRDFSIQEVYVSELTKNETLKKSFLFEFCERESSEIQNRSGGVDGSTKDRGSIKKGTAHPVEADQKEHIKDAGNNPIKAPGNKGEAGLHAMNGSEADNELKELLKILLGTLNNSILSHEKCVSDQNQILRKRNELISGQNEIMTKRNELLSEQNKLLTEQKNTLDILRESISTLASNIELKDHVNSKQTILPHNDFQTEMKSFTDSKDFKSILTQHVNAVINDNDSDGIKNFADHAYEIITKKMKRDHAISNDPSLADDQNKTPETLPEKDMSGVDRIHKILKANPEIFAPQILLKQRNISKDVSPYAENLPKAYDLFIKLKLRDNLTGAFKNKITELENRLRLFALYVLPPLEACREMIMALKGIEASEKPTEKTLLSDEEIIQLISAYETMHPNNGPWKIYEQFKAFNSEIPRHAKGFAGVFEGFIEKEVYGVLIENFSSIKAEDSGNDIFNEFLESLGIKEITYSKDDTVTGRNELFEISPQRIIKHDLSEGTILTHAGAGYILTWAGNKVLKKLPVTVSSRR